MDTFFDHLQANTTPLSQRYPGFMIYLPEGMDSDEKAVVLNLHAAIVVLATEIYGLRSEVVSNHERYDGHLFSFKRGLYTQETHDEKIRGFFLDCLRIGNRAGIIFDVGTNEKNGNFLTFDTLDDGYALVCGLVESKAFQERYSAKIGRGKKRDCEEAPRRIEGLSFKEMQALICNFLNGFLALDAKKQRISPDAPSLDF